MNIIKHADVMHNESGMAWTVWRIQHGRNVTYKARPGKRAPRDASGAVATAEEATGMFNLSPIGPIQYVQACVRQNKKRRILELFYVNSYPGKKYWWIDAYNKQDGFYQASRDYIRKETTLLRDPTPSAKALIQHWENIGLMSVIQHWENTESIALKETARIKAHLCTQLRGPAGYQYGGE